jgi:hypothetical protein
MIKINLNDDQLAQIAHLFTPPSDGAPWMVIAQIRDHGECAVVQLTGETAINVMAAKAGLAKPSKLNRERILRNARRRDGGE